MAGIVRDLWVPRWDHEKEGLRAMMGSETSFTVFSSCWHLAGSGIQLHDIRTGPYRSSRSSSQDPVYSLADFYWPQPPAERSSGKHKGQGIAGDRHSARLPRAHNLQLLESWFVALSFLLEVGLILTMRGRITVTLRFLLNWVLGKFIQMKTSDVGGLLRTVGISIRSWLSWL